MIFVSKNQKMFLFEVVFNKDIKPFHTTFKKGTKTKVSKIFKTKNGLDVY